MGGLMGGKGASPSIMTPAPAATPVSAPAPKSTPELAATDVTVAQDKEAKRRQQTVAKQSLADAGSGAPTLLGS